MKDYAEPHFNDEQTVRAAQPVVPLEKIEAKARHRRQWFLGGAFAIAMILGAASALVASYLKFRNVPATATELAVEPEVTPAPAPEQPEQIATPTPEEEQVAETVEEPAPPVEEPKKEPEPKRRIVAAQHSREPIAEPDTRDMTQQEHLQQIRDAVLYDEWQERRARRVLRRERRRAERYNHRDLSNLDEIFEGRRRRP
jgi:outer membrane biosynthesis protein TonB